MSTWKFLLATTAGAALFAASMTAHADDGRGGDKSRWNYEWFPSCCAYAYATPYYYYPPQYAYPPPAYAYPPPAYGYVVPR
jgi:hypothetical protein